MAFRPRHLAAIAGVPVALFALGTGIAYTRGPQPATPDPPGTFSFAALGDSPYNRFEDVRYRTVLEDLEAHDLSHVLHVGDLFWTPCTDGRYRRTLDEFNALRHPVIYTPGDNEWTDCWQHGDGALPLDRLAEIRRVFFAEPARSLGGRAISLEHQGGDREFGEHVENARWTHDGVVFATIHLVGSRNALYDFPGRSEADDAEAMRRTAAAAAWVRETFAAARDAGAPAVVVAFHGNPGFGDEVDDPYREAFEPALGTLAEEAEAFGRPVLVVQGDWHDYTVDHPVMSRSTGEPLGNVTRLQVPGSPHVGWVRVTVDPDAPEPFAFEPRVVPRWALW